jgi:hypothetical protein
MTYHPVARWNSDNEHRCAARGQEFIADICSTMNTLRTAVAPKPSIGRSVWTTRISNHATAA